MKQLLALLALSAAAWPQTKGDANAHYQTPEQRRNLARSLSDSARDQRQKPRILVRSLNIVPGSRVVDVGAGPGYMEPYLSEAVGPSGKVIAEDVQQDFLDMAREQATRLHLTNIEYVLGTANNPNLPAASAELVFALDAYHHFDNPAAILAAVKKALTPGGRLVIVDYYKRPDAMPGGNAVAHIRADRDQVVKEVEAAGFRLMEQRDHIPNSQYIIIFTAR